MDVTVPAFDADLVASGFTDLAAQLTETGRS